MKHQLFLILLTQLYIVGSKVSETLEEPCSPPRCGNAPTPFQRLTKSLSNTNVTAGEILKPISSRERKKSSSDVDALIRGIEKHVHEVFSSPEKIFTEGFPIENYVEKKPKLERDTTITRGVNPTATETTMSTENGIPTQEDEVFSPPEKIFTEGLHKENYVEKKPKLEIDTTITRGVNPTATESTKSTENGIPTQEGKPPTPDSVKEQQSEPSHNEKSDKKEWPPPPPFAPFRDVSSSLREMEKKRKGLQNEVNILHKETSGIDADAEDEILDCFSFKKCKECLKMKECGWCGAEFTCLNGNVEGPIFRTNDDCRSSWLHTDIPPGPTACIEGFYKENYVEKKPKLEIDTTITRGVNEIGDINCDGFLGTPGDCERAKVDLQIKAMRVAEKKNGNDATLPMVVESGDLQRFNPTENVTEEDSKGNANKEFHISSSPENIPKENEKLRFQEKSKDSSRKRSKNLKAELPTNSEDTTAAGDGLPPWVSVKKKSKEDELDSKAPFRLDRKSINPGKGPLSIMSTNYGGSWEMEPKANRTNPSSVGNFTMKKDKKEETKDKKEERTLVGFVSCKDMSLSVWKEKNESLQLENAMISAISDAVMDSTLSNNVNTVTGYPLQRLLDISNPLRPGSPHLVIDEVLQNSRTSRIEIHFTLKLPEMLRRFLNDYANVLRNADSNTISKQFEYFVSEHANAEKKKMEEQQDYTEFLEIESEMQRRFLGGNPRFLNPLTLFQSTVAKAVRTLKTPVSRKRSTAQSSPTTLKTPVSRKQSTAQSSSIQAHIIEAAKEIKKKKVLFDTHIPICNAPEIHVELVPQKFNTNRKNETEILVAHSCPTDGGDIRVGDTVWLRPVLPKYRDGGFLVCPRGREGGACRAEDTCPSWAALYSRLARGEKNNPLPFPLGNLNPMPPFITERVNPPLGYRAPYRFPPGRYPNRPPKYEFKLPPALDEIYPPLPPRVPPALDFCKDVNCGDHGECIKETGKCVCMDGYEGLICEIPPAPKPVDEMNIISFIERDEKTNEKKCIKRIGRPLEEGTDISFKNENATEVTGVIVRSPTDRHNIRFKYSCSDTSYKPPPYRYTVFQKGKPLQEVNGKDILWSRKGLEMYETVKMGEVDVLVVNDNEDGTYDVMKKDGTRLYAIGAAHLKIIVPDQEANSMPTIVLNCVYTYCGFPSGVSVQESMTWAQCEKEIDKFAKDEKAPLWETGGSLRSKCMASDEYWKLSKYQNLVRKATGLAEPISIRGDEYIDMEETCSSSAFKIFSSGREEGDLIKVADTVWLAGKNSTSFLKCIGDWCSTKSTCPGSFNVTGAELLHKHEACDKSAFVLFSTSAGAGDRVRSLDHVWFQNKKSGTWFNCENPEKCGGNGSCAIGTTTLKLLQEKEMKCPGYAFQIEASGRDPHDGALQPLEIGECAAFSIPSPPKPPPPKEPPKSGRKKFMGCLEYFHREGRHGCGIIGVAKEKPPKWPIDNRGLAGGIIKLENDGTFISGKKEEEVIIDQYLLDEKTNRTTLATLDMQINWCKKKCRKLESECDFWNVNTYETPQACQAVAPPSKNYDWSSLWDKNHATPTIDSGRSWCAKVNDKNQWLRIDLQDVKEVMGVYTQGRADAKQWVTSYKIKFSMNKNSFTDVEGGKIFDGNTEQFQRVNNKFKETIRARFISIHPQTWFGHVSLRFGVLLPCKAEKECYIGRSLQRNDFYLSSIWPHDPTGHNQGWLYSNLAWCAKFNKAGEWIAFDIGQNTEVAGVVTQGRYAHDQYVTKFKVYVAQGTESEHPNWKNIVKVLGRFEAVDGGKEFQGNTMAGNRNTLKTPFEKPVNARYVKIEALAWHNHISMRVGYLSHCSMKNGGRIPTDTRGKCITGQKFTGIAKQKDIVASNFRLNGDIEYCRDQCLANLDICQWGIEFDTLSKTCMFVKLESCLEDGVTPADELFPPSPRGTWTIERKYCFTPPPPPPPSEPEKSVADIAKETRVKLLEAGLDRVIAARIAVMVAIKSSVAYALDLASHKALSRRKEANDIANANDSKGSAKVKKEIYKATHEDDGKMKEDVEKDKKSGEIIVDGQVISAKSEAVSFNQTRVWAAKDAGKIMSLVALKAALSEADAAGLNRTAMYPRMAKVAARALTIEQLRRNPLGFAGELTSGESVTKMQMIKMSNVELYQNLGVEDSVKANELAEEALIDALSQDDVGNFENDLALQAKEVLTNPSATLKLLFGKLLDSAEESGIPLESQLQVSLDIAFSAFMKERMRLALLRDFSAFVQRMNDTKFDVVKSTEQKWLPWLPKNWGGAFLQLSSYSSLQHAKMNHESSSAMVTKLPEMVLGFVEKGLDLAKELGLNLSMSLEISIKAAFAHVGDYAAAATPNPLEAGELLANIVNRVVNETKHYMTETLPKAQFNSTESQSANVTLAMRREASYVAAVSLAKPLCEGRMYDFNEIGQAVRTLLILCGYSRDEAKLYGSEAAAVSVSKLMMDETATPLVDAATEALGLHLKTPRLVANVIERAKKLGVGEDKACLMGPAVSARLLAQGIAEQPVENVENFDPKLEGRLERIAMETFETINAANCTHSAKELIMAGASGAVLGVNKSMVQRVKDDGVADWKRNFAIAELLRILSGMGEGTMLSMQDRKQLAGNLTVKSDTANEKKEAIESAAMEARMFNFSPIETIDHVYSRVIQFEQGSGSVMDAESDIDAESDVDAWNLAWETSIKFRARKVCEVRNLEKPEKILPNPHWGMKGEEGSLPPSPEEAKKQTKELLHKNIMRIKLAASEVARSVTDISMVKQKEFRMDVYDLREKFGKSAALAFAKAMRENGCEQWQIRLGVEQLLLKSELKNVCASTMEEPSPQWIPFRTGQKNPNKHFKFSSVYGGWTNYEHQRPSIDSPQAWTAAVQDKNQWISLDLMSKHWIAGVYIQGRRGRRNGGSFGNQFVSSYKVSTAIEEGKWVPIENGKIFVGNSWGPGKLEPSQKRVRSIFSEPVKARYIKVMPQTWNKYISLRLGVISFALLTDEAIETSRQHTEDVARLLSDCNRVYDGNPSTFWEPFGNYTGSWLQMNFKKPVEVDRLRILFHQKPNSPKALSNGFLQLRLKFSEPGDADQLVIFDEHNLNMFSCLGQKVNTTGVRFMIERVENTTFPGIVDLKLYGRKGVKLNYHQSFENITTVGEGTNTTAGGATNTTVEEELAKQVEEGKKIAEKLFDEEIERKKKELQRNLNAKENEDEEEIVDEKGINVCRDKSSAIRIGDVIWLRVMPIVRDPTSKEENRTASFGNLNETNSFLQCPQEDRAQYPPPINATLALEKHNRHEVNETEATRNVTLPDLVSTCRMGGRCADSAFYFPGLPPWKDPLPVLPEPPPRAIDWLDVEAKEKKRIIDACNGIGVLDYLEDPNTGKPFELQGALRCNKKVLQQAEKEMEKMMNRKTKEEQEDKTEINFLEMYSKRLLLRHRRVFLNEDDNVAATPKEEETTDAESESESDEEGTLEEDKCLPAKQTCSSVIAPTKQTCRVSDHCMLKDEKCVPIEEKCGEIEIPTRENCLAEDHCEFKSAGLKSVYEMLDERMFDLKFVDPNTKIIPRLLPLPPNIANRGAAFAEREKVCGLEAFKIYASNKENGDFLSIGDTVWLLNQNPNSTMWLTCQDESCHAHSTCPHDDPLMLPRGYTGDLFRRKESECFGSAFVLWASSKDGQKRKRGGAVYDGDRIWLQQKHTGALLNCPANRTCGADGNCLGVSDLFDLLDSNDTLSLDLEELELDETCTSQSFEVHASNRNTEDGGLGLATIASCTASSSITRNKTCSKALDGNPTTWWEPWRSSDGAFIEMQFWTPVELSRFRFLRNPFWGRGVGKGGRKCTFLYDRHRGGCGEDSKEVLGKDGPLTFEECQRRCLEEQDLCRWGIEWKLGTCKFVGNSMCGYENKEINVPESRRAYSSVRFDSLPGNGFARSKLDSPLGWMPSVSNIATWLALDLGKIENVIEIITQGVHSGPGSTHFWVKSYHLSISNDGIHWNAVYLDSNENHTQRTLEEKEAAVQDSTNLNIPLNNQHNKLLTTLLNLEKEKKENAEQNEKKTIKKPIKTPRPNLEMWNDSRKGNVKVLKNKKLRKGGKQETLKDRRKKVMKALKNEKLSFETGGMKGLVADKRGWLHLRYPAYLESLSSLAIKSKERITRAMWGTSSSMTKDKSTLNITSSIISRAQEKAKVITNVKQLSSKRREALEHGDLDLERAVGRKRKRSNIVFPRIDQSKDIKGKIEILPDKETKNVKEWMGFKANFDAETHVVNAIPPTRGRYIRIEPTSWFNEIGMRAAVTVQRRQNMDEIFPPSQKDSDKWKILEKSCFNVEALAEFNVTNDRKSSIIVDSSSNFLRETTLDSTLKIKLGFLNSDDDLIMDIPLFGDPDLFYCFPPVNTTFVRMSILTPFLNPNGSILDMDECSGSFECSQVGQRCHSGPGYICCAEDNFDCSHTSKGGCWKVGNSCTPGQGFPGISSLQFFGRPIPDTLRVGDTIWLRNFESDRSATYNGSSILEASMLNNDTSWFSCLGDTKRPGGWHTSICNAWGQCPTAFLQTRASRGIYAPPFGTAFDTVHYFRTMGGGSTDRSSRLYWARKAKEDSVTEPPKEEYEEQQQAETEQNVLNFLEESSLLLNLPEKKDSIASQNKTDIWNTYFDSKNMPLPINYTGPEPLNDPAFNMSTEELRSNLTIAQPNLGKFSNLTRGPGGYTGIPKFAPEGAFATFETDACPAESFRIYASGKEIGAEIQSGDYVYLLSKQTKHWLSCNGTLCSGNGTCPGNHPSGFELANRRGNCTGEEFRLFAHNRTIGDKIEQDDTIFMQLAEKTSFVSCRESRNRTWEGRDFKKILAEYNLDDADYHTDSSSNENPFDFRFKSKVRRDPLYSYFKYVDNMLRNADSKTNSKKVLKSNVAKVVQSKKRVNNDEKGAKFSPDNFRFRFQRKRSSRRRSTEKNCQAKQPQNIDDNERCNAETTEVSCLALMTVDGSPLCNFSPKCTSINVLHGDQRCIDHGCEYTPGTPAVPAKPAKKCQQPSCDARDKVSCEGSGCNYDPVLYPDQPCRPPVCEPFPTFGITANGGCFPGCEPIGAVEAIPAIEAKCSDRIEDDYGESMEENDEEDSQDETHMHPFDSLNSNTLMNIPLPSPPIDITPRTPLCSVDTVNCAIPEPNAEQTDYMLNALDCQEMSFGIHFSSTRTTPRRLKDGLYIIEWRVDLPLFQDSLHQLNATARAGLFSEADISPHELLIANETAYASELCVIYSKPPSTQKGPELFPCRKRDAGPGPMDVWRIQWLQDNLYTVEARVIERDGSIGDFNCLAATDEAISVTPERRHWGEGLTFCGFPAATEKLARHALLENKQAVWEIERLQGSNFRFKSHFWDGDCVGFYPPMICRQKEEYAVSCESAADASYCTNEAVKTEEECTGGMCYEMELRAVRDARLAAERAKAEKEAREAKQRAAEAEAKAKQAKLDAEASLLKKKQGEVLSKERSAHAEKMKSLADAAVQASREAGSRAENAENAKTQAKAAYDQALSNQRQAKAALTAAETAKETAQQALTDHKSTDFQIGPEPTAVASPGAEPIGPGSGPTAPLNPTVAEVEEFNSAYSAWSQAQSQYETSLQQWEQQSAAYTAWQQAHNEWKTASENYESTKASLMSTLSSAEDAFLTAFTAEQNANQAVAQLKSKYDEALANWQKLDRAKKEEEAKAAAAEEIKKKADAAKAKADENAAALEARVAAAEALAKSEKERAAAEHLRSENALKT
eukprot:g2054.t1